ncbi:hypothetical protein RchiOBHm_Chr6g0267161 [Rosa chinensis]|uniref:Uncharacterized protein n=1 Tax=Rosa chinensis TaxID=74649 RepID=A0A2P6PPY4_ROSCH|nr:hypothetical protein RchiOBHm_Chr6g0267161 [Rosa chinensis]
MLKKVSFNFFDSDAALKPVQNLRPQIFSLSRYPSSDPTTSTVKTTMTRPCHRTPRLRRRRSRSRRNRRSLRLPWLRR